MDRSACTAVSLLRVAAIAATTFLAAAAQAGPRDPVVVAVGDLACQALTHGQGEGACRSGEIADLIRSIAPDKFLGLGDLQYNNGKLTKYMRVWDVQFGDLRGITAPAPGNHDYGTPDAAGYFAYFGPVANPPVGYYSFNLGKWHIFSPNSPICGGDVGCGPGTPQYEWLAADLAASNALYPYGFGSMPENLVTTQNKSFGLLKLTLHRDSYDYEWVTLPGDAAFADSGMAVPCN